MPPLPERFTRRELLKTVAAVGVTWTLTGLGKTAPAAAAENPSDVLINESLVIDGVLYSTQRRDCSCTPSGVGEIKRQTGITAAAWSVSTSRLAELNQWLAGRPDLAPITTGSDLDAAAASGRFGVIFYDQHSRGVGLGSSVVPLAERKTRGLRIFQIAYSDSTELGGGDDPRYSEAPLTSFGRDVVRELNRLRMVVDVSHCGRRTTLDVTETSSAPVVATHCSARRLTNHYRAKHDDALRGIARTGGVIGVMAVGRMIRRSAGRGTIDDFVAHIDYLVQLVGIDHVGVASDAWLDGVPVLPDVDATDEFLMNPRRWVHVATRLLAKGYSLDALRKLVGLNFRRVFQQILDP